MRRFIYVALFFLTTGIFNLPTCFAQTDPSDFMQKQFYGNRVKGGSILLNASIQHTGYGEENVDGVTGNLGLGVGIGLSENFVVSLGYERERMEGLFTDNLGQVLRVTQTNHSFQAGFRLLINTVGGFIQPYTGIDAVLLWSGFKETNDFDQSFAGARIPVGMTIWISTFMAISFEPVNLSLIGETTEEAEFNSEFNAELNLLNPTFGISFLLNGKKP